MAGFDQWLAGGLGTVAGQAWPVWVAGGLAALMFFIVVLAFLRAAQSSRARTLLRVALLVAGVGLVAVLAGSLGSRDHSAARRALDVRAAELTLRAVAPGSPIACLDSVANATVEAACEKLLFASPETIAAAMAYIDAKLALLSDSLDLAARDGGYGSSIERLRRTVEEDRFGMVAQVLVTRGCTPDNCSAFRLLRDPRRVITNLRERKFDASVVLNTPAWRNEKNAAMAPVAAVPGVPAVASVPHVATTGTAPTARFEYPSAASIPAISIMNAEPQLPPGEAAAAPPQNGTPAAKPAPAPRRQSAREAPPREAPQQAPSVPLPLAPPGTLSNPR